MFFGWVVGDCGIFVIVVGVLVKLFLVNVF